MGLLDAREDLSRTGVKFPRPKIERVFTAGAGNNLALELARTEFGGHLPPLLEQYLDPNARDLAKSLSENQKEIVKKEVSISTVFLYRLMLRAPGGLYQNCKLKCEMASKNAF